MKNFLTQVNASILICVFLMIAGCNSGPEDMPEIGTVTGTVTLDGQPLEAADIFFAPENGRTSTGTTDAAGKYELTYNPTTKGAKIGKNMVRITTFKEFEGDPDAKNSKEPARKELVPSEYNQKTTLTADVKAGENTFDFDLKSK